MNLQEITNHKFKKLQKPVLIAGPCSAESENQVLETARRIKDSGAEVSYFRAGIWKPRTKPNGFEGVGEIGLSWLKKVKQEVGYPTATEVAHAHHVQAALEADVDLLWIGARSTVNPFTVQEIADALQGSDKMVFVKNPVNPDLSLWIGAMERLVARDIKNIGAIHRGFSTYQKTKYRNTPNWQIAIDFKNHFPNIPLIGDPSHICGNREDIFEVAQEALNLGYDGLMIESHSSPDDAWSDAAQQITPERLADILSHLKIRDSGPFSLNEEMERNRMMISDIDFQLIHLLSQRMNLAREIGKLKKANNMTVFQPDRWKIITEYAEKKAAETNMDPDFVKNIFKAVHEESVTVQNKIMLE